MNSKTDVLNNAAKMYEKMVEHKIKPLCGFVVDEGDKAFFISKSWIVDDEQTMIVFEIVKEKETK